MVRGTEIGTATPTSHRPGGFSSVTADAVIRVATSAGANREFAVRHPHQCRPPSRRGTLKSMFSARTGRRATLRTCPSGQVDATAAPACHGRAGQVPIATYGSDTRVDGEGRCDAEPEPRTRARLELVDRGSIALDRGSIEAPAPRVYRSRPRVEVRDPRIELTGFENSSKVEGTRPESREFIFESGRSD